MPTVGTERPPLSPPVAAEKEAHHMSESGPKAGAKGIVEDVKGKVKEVAGT